MVTVTPRSEWGARYADGGGPAPVPFSEWWLHHSVTIAPDLLPPFDDEYRAMRVLEDIGQQRFGQGISYTFPIMPTGRVYRGHSIDRLGAHTGGRNSAARAICFVGNYDVQQPTAAQIEAAAQLMVQEYRAGRAKTYRLNGGHRDVKATDCPGNNAYAAIAAINTRAAAIIGGAPPLDLEDDMPWTLHETRLVEGSLENSAEARRIAGEVDRKVTALDAKLEEILAAIKAGGGVAGAVDVGAVAAQLTVVPKG